MKKSTLFSSAMLAALAISQNAYASDPTSTTVYDQSPWNNEQVLKLFSDAYDQGRNYPTKAEWDNISMGIEREFVRSHTRYRSIYKDADKDVVSDINHDRLLWCNLPAGYGKQTGGYPQATFDQDVFSFWNYTNLFGAWNYGFLMAPGSWIDAAHKNGTRMYGGIKFFESWNNSAEEAAFNAFVTTKNDDGSYKYARAFVNAAAYFGNDGYNYNQEGSTWSSSDWVNFHKAVMDEARGLNIEGFGIGQYTTQSGLTASNVGTLYGTKATGKIYDCMLNYSANKLSYYNVSNSITQANNGPGLDGVYQGELLVNLSSDYWTQMNTTATKPMNIVIWGEHDQSRFFQFRVGKDPISTQENYQLLLEKAFSGANRNPLKRPAINNSWGSFQVADFTLAETQLNNSPGFASMFPERTAIGGHLPFETHFALGNGEAYFYKGKVTAGPWYNMSQQDIVPTYRWLVTAKNNMSTYANDIDVRFTHEDAYMAGSSLKLTGATTSGNDIVLYRTQLSVSNGTPTVTVALKNGLAGTNASNLSVIVRKQGSSNWIEVPCGNLDGKAWQEKQLNISGLSQGDVIEYVGLRVNGTTTADYKMLVGKLKISDDFTVACPEINPESLMLEVREENTESLSVKFAWEPNYTGYTTSESKFGMVYNDEINVDHFEIFFKHGEDGKVQEVGRTAQWATYIGQLPVKPGEDAWIGVRAVATDLASVSKVEWVQIPHYEGTIPEAAVEDPYGKTFLFNYGSSTLESILSTIYWETITTTGATQNINYSKSSNPVLGTPSEADNYFYAEDYVLEVEQGQEVEIFLKAKEAGSDCLKYDFVYLYMDYDGNYSFLDSDETLGSVGNLNSGTPAISTPGVSFKFTVPSDAKTGNTRLRIVGSDAWGAHPGPTGGTWKGHSIDFPVVIKGSNAERHAAETYLDRRDEGQADEPDNYVSDYFSGIEDVVTDAAAPSVEVLDNVAYFNNVEKAWFYDVNGRVVKHVADAASSANVSDLAKGVYVVKMLNNRVVTSTKVVVK